MEDQQKDGKAKKDISHARRMFWTFISMSTISVASLLIASIWKAYTISGILLTFGLMSVTVIVLGTIAEDKPDRPRDDP